MDKNKLVCSENAKYEPASNADEIDNQQPSL
jgi:hypothetical protein